MIGLIWRTLRPQDWVKNVFVLAPLFFSGAATDPGKIVMALVAFAAFSAVSSAAYVVNDIIDRERDRRHPIKRHRPIASGALPIGVASATFVFLVVIAATSAYASDPAVAVLLAAYLGINLAYSFRLKHIVIVDVFSIAAGFVLRVIAGAIAIDVEPTAWLLMATFLLSLFLALAKRRHELVLLEEKSDAHRPVLNSYSPKLVDELISVVTPVTLVTYLLYTVDSETIQRFNSDRLYATGVFVVFGIFRYLYLIHRLNKGGSPTELVLKDPALIMAILGWVISFSLIIYTA